MAYRVGPSTERLLWKCCEIPTIISRAGRYNGNPFTGSMGVTQFEPLSPTIFSMVVDAVIFHWAMRVAVEDAGIEGFGREVQKLSALFYAYENFLASPWPDRLQEDLDTLLGLFDQVGLWTITENMVSMVCQP